MRCSLLTACLALTACRPPAEPVNPEPSARAQPGAGPAVAIVEAEPEPPPEPTPPQQRVREFEADPETDEPPPGPEAEDFGPFVSKRAKPSGVADGIGSTDARGVSGVSGPSTMAGALSKDQIREVVKRNLKGVKACYQSGLTKNPQLEGRIMITYVIGTDGKVIEATVKSSSLADNQVAACVQKHILTWQFPKPKGGGVVRVSYPFVFKTG